MPELTCLLSTAALALFQKLLYFPIFILLSELIKLYDKTNIYILWRNLLYHRRLHHEDYIPRYEPLQAFKCEKCGKVIAELIEFWKKHQP